MRAERARMELERERHRQERELEEERQRLERQHREARQQAPQYRQLVNMLLGHLHVGCQPRHWRVWHL